MSTLINLDDKWERLDRDEKTYKNLDRELCMLCGASGPDKRSFRLSCLYDVKEVIPEALELRDEARLGFYLLLCKSCRALLLEGLQDAADQCRTNRGKPMNQDGVIELDPERNIPVRVHGAASEEKQA